MATDPYDRYFYSGTDVFINKLGIHDAQELYHFEYQWTENQTPEAQLIAQEASVLNAQTFKNIHKALFGDIYAWGGEFRTLPIFKDSTAFAPFPSEGVIDAIFSDFEAKAKVDSSHMGRLAGHLARLWGLLNFQHPFVEGNGRTTQIIVKEAARRYGWYLKFEELERADELDAAIRSCMPSLGDERFYGYHDVMMRIMHPLEREKHEFGDSGR